MISVWYGTIPYHTIPYHTIPNHTEIKFREHFKHLLLKVRESKVGSEFDFGMVWYHTIPYHTIPYHTIPNHTLILQKLPSCSRFNYCNKKHLYHGSRGLVKRCCASTNEGKPKGASFYLKERNKTRPKTTRRCPSHKIYSVAFSCASKHASDYFTFPYKSM